jgi:hypothetical protein
MVSASFVMFQTESFGFWHVAFSEDRPMLSIYLFFGRLSSYLIIEEECDVSQNRGNICYMEHDTARRA